jgi:CPA2 family monovalent cation:H+ antiporter-2
MLVDPLFLMANLGTVLTVVVLISLGKGLVFSGLAFAFGYRNVIPLALGFGMFQLSEFSFVIARMGLREGVFDADLYSLILTSALVTILLTPLAFQLVNPLYAQLRRLRPARVYNTFDLPKEELDAHVVIAGAGRVGQYVAQVLTRLNLHFVAVELDLWRVEQCKAASIPVIYGDATQHTVLEAAAIRRARLLLITTPAISVTQAVVEQVRRMAPELHIVARAEGVEPMHILHELGVYEVVQPEFEAALEIVRQAMLHLSIPTTEIQRYTDAVRQELYAPLYTRLPSYATVVQLQNAQQLLGLEWTTLPEQSPLVGRMLGELKIRARTGATVVAVLAEGKTVPNPKLSHRFAPGEMVAIFGAQEQRAAFIAWAITGPSVQPMVWVDEEPLNE